MYDYLYIFWTKQINSIEIEILSLNKCIKCHFDTHRDLQQQQQQQQQMSIREMSEENYICSYGVYF